MGAQVALSLDETHLRHDAMYGRVLVAEATLAGGELAEVAGGVGADVVKEAEADAACGGAVDGDVELRAGSVRDGEERRGAGTDEDVGAVGGVAAARRGRGALGALVSGRSGTTTGRGTYGSETMVGQGTDGEKARGGAFLWATHKVEDGGHAGARSRLARQRPSGDLRAAPALHGP
ncbi:hypothetical protein EIP86_002141 [Pleurotus ostreatoroseus]|nr:hypothetical protein EIP86_002141 [Pleurotus ostreatoroseus]